MDFSFRGSAFCILDHLSLSFFLPIISISFFQFVLFTKFHILFSHTILSVVLVVFCASCSWFFFLKWFCSFFFHFWTLLTLISSVVITLSLFLQSCTCAGGLTLEHWTNCKLFFIPVGIMWQCSSSLVFFRESSLYIWEFGTVFKTWSIFRHSVSYLFIYLVFIYLAYRRVSWNNVTGSFLWNWLCLGKGTFFCFSAQIEKIIFCNSVPLNCQASAFRT